MNNLATFISNRIILIYREKGLSEAVDKYWEYFSKDSFKQYKEDVDRILKEKNYMDILGEV